MYEQHPYAWNPNDTLFWFQKTLEFQGLTFKNSGFSIWALGFSIWIHNPLLTYLKLRAPELSVLSELNITWRRWHNDVLPQQTLMSCLDFMYSVTNHIACFIRASTLAHLGLERLALGWWQCACSPSVEMRETGPTSSERWGRNTQSSQKAMTWSNEAENHIARW